MRAYEESEELRETDTEITLGMKSTLGIFFGLALICGVFFGFGYSLGHGNSGRTAIPVMHATAPQSPSAIGTVVEGSGSLNNSAGEPDPDTYVARTGGPKREPASISPSEPVAATAAASQAPISTTVPTGQLAPANISYSIPAPVKTGPAAASQPSALPASIMVQIAAVSRRDDADVLVAALRKLGYNASERTERGDSLLHVQIGPFSTRDQAKAMRARLLSDGYNAILK